MTRLDDFDELECPEEIEDVDQLRNVLSDVVHQHNRLLVEVRRLDNLVVDALETRRTTREGLDDLQDDVERLRMDVDLLDGTVPNKNQTKIERIRGIVSYAVTEATGGPAGVVIETGEATAAANSGRNTALRLMDEIGTTFRWASVENPGGPNPKQLRIATKDRTVTGLMDDVREEFTDSNAATG